MLSPLAEYQFSTSVRCAALGPINQPGAGTVGTLTFSQPAGVTFDEPGSGAGEMHRPMHAGL